MTEKDIHLSRSNDLWQELGKQRWPDYLIESLLAASVKTEEVQKRLMGITDSSPLHLVFQTHPDGEKGFTTRMLNEGMETRDGLDWTLFGVLLLEPESVSGQELESAKFVGVPVHPDPDTAMDATVWKELPQSVDVQTVTNRYVMWLHWVCYIHLLTGVEMRVAADPDGGMFFARGFIDGMYLVVYHNHAAAMRLIDRQRMIEAATKTEPTNKTIN